MKYLFKQVFVEKLVQSQNNENQTISYYLVQPRRTNNGESVTTSACYIIAALRQHLQHLGTGECISCACAYDMHSIPIKTFYVLPGNKRREWLNLQLHIMFQNAT